MVEYTIKSELIEIRTLLVNNRGEGEVNTPWGLCKLLEARGLLGPLIRLGLWNKEFLEVTSYWQFNGIFRDTEILRNLPVKNRYPNPGFRSDIDKRYIFSSREIIEWDARVIPEVAIDRLYWWNPLDIDKRIVAIDKMLRRF